MTPVEIPGFGGSLGTTIPIIEGRVKIGGKCQPKKTNISVEDFSKTKTFSFQLQGNATKSFFTHLILPSSKFSRSYSSPLDHYVTSPH